MSHLVWTHDSEKGFTNIFGSLPKRLLFLQASFLNYIIQESDLICNLWVVSLFGGICRVFHGTGTYVDISNAMSRCYCLVAVILQANATAMELQMEHFVWPIAPATAGSAFGSRLSAGSKILSSNIGFLKRNFWKWVAIKGNEAGIFFLRMWHGAGEGMEHTFLRNSFLLVVRLRQLHSSSCPFASTTRPECFFLIPSNKDSAVALSNSFHNSFIPF